jgi:2-C-methyl-D-erythritol 4-phosphate cytidylyltransferase
MTVESGRLRIATGVPVHFLVPAAGSGSRFGGEQPKQFRDVAGRPLLLWTVARLLRAGAESITIALPEAALTDPPAWARSLPGVALAAGGSTRQASVALALAASPAKAEDLVAVHDGARPAVAVGDIAAVCVAAAGGVDGAVLGRALADTLKRVVDGRIVTTVERDQLFRAETPQVFRRSALDRAIALAAESRFVGTDEASLVERLPGARIVAVEASEPNPKVTTPADLALVESLLSGLGDPEEVREWR